MTKLIPVWGLALCASFIWAQPPTVSSRSAKTPEMLQAEIESLQSPKVAWRGIAWRPCLLEGLKESRAQKKPMILWVFIDRPVDDQRC